jgi:hypothetical protein
MDEYEVQLSDGSTITVEAASEEEAMKVAARIIQMKASEQQPSAAPTQRPMTEAETVQDIAAGASRGMAPYAAAAGLGALAGAPFAGVGAGPGAAAGVAAVGAAQFIGDPLVDSVNSLFGTKFTKPTEALNQLMDMAGMAKPQSEAGQLAEKATSGAVGALSGVGAARSIAAGAAPGSFWQGVSRTMAEAPIAQVASGAAAGGAAELARQSGAGPIGQTVAGLAGGLGVGATASTLGNFGSKIGMPAPPRSDLPMLEQGFDNTTNMTVRIPMQQQQRAPLPMTYEDVARDARTAATGGMGSQQAVERLARAAPLNKDAAAAAERLGIDVPPDVLMDHTQLKEAIGLTRSMTGTVASAAWTDAVERAATQADEAMAMIDGSPDLSEINQVALNRMNATKAELEGQAKEIYKRIDAKISGGAEPPTVDLVNSRRLMNKVVSSLGGKTQKLTSLEKEVMEMASPKDGVLPTYEELRRLKNDVGQAVEKASGPYADMNEMILKRLYSVLAEDQLYNVQQIGGKQLRDDLRLANQTYAKQVALGKRIVSLFGDERDGSIAQKLLTTIKSGSKGDITGFNRIVQKLPQDLRAKAVATAISAAAREEKTNGFGFSKYVNLYQGLRRNSEVYKTVVQTLGPDSDKFLRDLYEVSKRITEARAQVLTTGKANQALVQGMMAEGLVEGVLRNTVGKKTVMGVPIAGPMVEALTKSNKNKLNAAGDLFASPEWQQLVINVSTQQNVNQKIYNAAKNSGAFKKWAREAGITDPDQWLRSTISSTIGMGAAEKTQPYQAGMGRPE